MPSFLTIQCTAQVNAGHIEVILYLEHHIHANNSRSRVLYTVLIIVPSLRNSRKVFLDKQRARMHLSSVSAQSTVSERGLLKKKTKQVKKLEQK